MLQVRSAFIVSIHPNAARGPAADDTIVCKANEKLSRHSITRAGLHPIEGFLWQRTDNRDHRARGRAQQPIRGALPPAGRVARRRRAGAARRPPALRRFADRPGRPPEGRAIAARAEATAAAGLPTRRTHRVPAARAAAVPTATAGRSARARPKPRHGLPPTTLRRPSRR